MVTEKELQEAIDELESGKSSYDKCAILAALYSLKDRYYPAESYSLPISVQAAEPQKRAIKSDKSSDFLKVVDGKSWEDILPDIDELLSAVKVLQPQLYEAFLRRF